LVVFEEWEALTRAHPASRFLCSDPLYALSAPLIDAIRDAIPTFFTPEDERFKRDLARSASLCFFCHRPLGDTSGTEAGQRAEERWERSQREIHEMLEEELRLGNIPPGEIRDHFETEQTQLDTTNEHLEAYLGWLVLNPMFRLDVRDLRTRWESAIREVGRFPRFSLMLLPDPTAESGLPAECRDEFYEFYAAWCLDSMQTWEVPIAMFPDLNLDFGRDPRFQRRSGVSLFIPWSMIQGESVNFRELMARSRTISVPDHLREWAPPAGQNGPDLGRLRHRNLFWLYRYWHLALKAHFPEAIRGRQQPLDRAFGSVLERGEDTIKKLRLELDTSLKRDPASPFEE